LRTLDGVSGDKRVGLYVINDVFDADGILTSKPYRTNPIQVFFEDNLSIEEQLQLKDYFNSVLNYFRDLTFDAFLTTYKYMDGKTCVRKFLSLKQAKKLIETFSLK